LYAAAICCWIIEMLDRWQRGMKPITQWTAEPAQILTLAGVDHQQLDNLIDVDLISEHCKKIICV